MLRIVTSLMTVTRFLFRVYSVFSSRARPRLAGGGGGEGRSIHGAAPAGAPVCVRGVRGGAGEGGGLIVHKPITYHPRNDRRRGSQPAEIAARRNL